MAKSFYWLAKKLPTSLIDTFLKTISFCVNVPVLSLRIYWTLPNSSGIWLFLAKAPSIYLSLFILYEKTILEKSKFTLKLIGIIDDKSKTCLNKSNIQYYPKPPDSTIIVASMTMKTNNTLDK